MPGSEKSIRTRAVGSKADRFSTSWYAEVAPCIPLPATGPQVYTYRAPAGVVPDELLYTQVRISLGARHIQGVVTRLHQARVPYPTKELRLAAGWQLTANQVALATWLHETMRGGWGYTLRLFFPPGKGGTTSSSAVPVPAIRPVDRPGALRAARPYQPGDSAIVEKEELVRVRAIATQIRQALTLQQQALVIVPEKWMIERLYKIVRKELPGVVIAQSEAALSTAAATKLWQDVQEQRVAVVIGTQKSLFLPWAQLGAIVVEEEFYSTHKLWDQYPRLDNRWGAGALAAIHHTSVTYATSLPSLALYHAITQGRVLAARQHPLVPRSTITPLTFADHQARRLLPEQLIDQMKGWLKAKEHIVVLHNARGAWRTLLCRSCHTAVRCPKCGVAAVVHGTGKKMALECHHCDTSFSLPEKCPVCRRTTLVMFGAGTEKMSEVLQALFPASIVRHITATTDSSPKSLRKKTGTISIGTSAIFTRVLPRSCDRVIYLFPERALQYPDFRSEERVMATLGRLAQLTARPRAIVIVTAKKSLVRDSSILFSPKNYDRLLVERKRLGYPPYQDLVLATLQSVTSVRARSKAAVVRQRIEDKQLPISVRGPFASYQKMRRGQQEQHLLLLGQLDDLRTGYADQPLSSIDVAPERIL